MDSSQQSASQLLVEWAAAYADAQVHAAPGLTQKVASTQIHSTIGDAPDPAWAGAMEQLIMRGYRNTTDVVAFQRELATVLVKDRVPQIPKGWFRGWRAVVARLDLMKAPVPSVPHKFRMATTAVKVAGRDAVKRIL